MKKKFFSVTVILAMVMVLLSYYARSYSTLLAAEIIGEVQETANDGGKSGSGNSSSNNSYIWISDISYEDGLSFASGSNSIHRDENADNGILTLMLDGREVPFIKGMCAWATSEIVYDLSAYQYDYFTSYLGVDVSEKDEDYFNTGVVFYIYTSADGVNWEEKYKSAVLKGESDAEFVKISINNAKYLKLVADDNSDAWWSEWYDEAVWADAMLIKEGYVEDTTNVEFIKTVAEYDADIKGYYSDSTYNITGEYEAVLLKREFVKNVGYDILQALARTKAEYRDTIEWLMGDTEVLRLYLVAGKPEGSYLNSIRVLSELYTEYKDDLADETITEYGTRLGDLYRTMMLALSLTESGKVYFWMDGVCYSDALTRYQIYKDLHLHAGQSAELIENRIFESLTVEEMRWVMNTVIDDEEIVWLNDYVRNEGDGKISPYNYITYTFDYDYSLDKYYSEENYAAWDEKYHLSEYNITYEKGRPKLWIVFEEGSVCGGLSKTGSCIWGAFKGLPNTCISQPAHCAYIYYTQNEDGDGVWELGNNVSGWGQSGKTEHLNVRTMNDWGSGSYTTGWNANYILLAQAAQNEYESYEKAEIILMLLDVYKEDAAEREKIYKAAINEEKLNFDAWLGLVYLYNEDTSKTEADYYALAEKIADTFTYYPYPMNDLINLIKPHLTSLEYETMFTMLQTRTLTTAAGVSENDSIQVLAVRQVANQLLGNIDTSIASFSFDGEDAGKIILSERFDGLNMAWEYSLDGKKTWIFTEEHEILLTAEELALITAENDIKIHIVGMDYADENIYTIDIFESQGLPSNLYANDRENKLIGVVSAMEWKYAENADWTSYGDVKPDLTGNKSVIVRMGATGTYLAEENGKTFSFTKDIVSDVESYISVEKLSVHYVSSEQAGSDYAEYAIDGNINTIWHTAHDASDTERTIIIKLEEPVYLSVLEYVPRQNGTNGRAKAVIVYVSLDAENWNKAGSTEDWSNDSSAKMLKFSEVSKVQYVKFVVTENWGDGRSFASAAMINLFEDVTAKSIPTAEVEYDVIETTVNSVIAQLVNPSKDITITNNDGRDTYIFTENGEFTFEFVDKYGNKGSVTAAVTWIIKEPETPEEPEAPEEPEEPETPEEPEKAEDSKKIIEERWAGKAGWQKIGGVWYYFNDNGELITGWVADYDAKWYYMDKETGKMMTGWVQSQNSKLWYYMDKTSGEMKLNDWFCDPSSGLWYYLDSNGAMCTSWIIVADKWYLLDSDGAMCTGWNTVNGEWYFLGADGVMLTGWQEIAGEEYYFNESGKCLMNTITPDGFTVDINGVKVK